MKIVLTDNVAGVGDIGETVEVRNGFGRNYLVPKGLALELNTRNAKKVQHHMLQIDAKKRRLKVQAEELASGVRDISLAFELRMGSGGKAFGSVSSREIAQRLCERGIDVDRRRVLLSDPLRKAGVHFVSVRLHPEVTVQVKVIIEKVGATAAEERQEAEEARDRLERNSAGDAGSEE